MHPILQFSARRTNWTRYPEASSTGDRSYCKLISGRSVVRSFRLRAVVAASWVHLTPLADGVYRDQKRAISQRSRC